MKKKVIVILREASEGDLQTEIENLTEKDYILIGFPQVTIDLLGAEIWYCTMQGETTV